MTYLFTFCLICGFYIKFNYFTKIQTPNSPPTFNLNQDQLREIQVDLDTLSFNEINNVDNLTIEELNELDLDITIGEYPEIHVIQIFQIMPLVLMIYLN